MAQADQPAAPAFRDAASCRKWLAQLQFTNLRGAHSQLLTSLLEFNRSGVSAQERLETLESLRETLAWVQDEYAKRLVGKPLPLDEPMLLVFLAIAQLWQAMAAGYRNCLEAHMAGGRHPGKSAALLCQRSMRYTGFAVLEYLRTGYEPDERLWHQLHELYVIAETHDLLSAQVADPLGRGSAHGTCRDTYLGTLLTAYANPMVLGRSRLRQLDLWLPRWLGMLAVERSYIPGKGNDAKPLAFDLNDPHHGLQPARSAKAGDSVRYVAMVPLSKLIRVKTILLQQGKTPAEVELGEMDDSRECIALLTCLHQHWCEDADRRLATRADSGHHAEVCYPADRIHTLLAGIPSSPPADASRKKDSMPGGWHIDNESLLGGQLTRLVDRGGPLMRNQLLGLRQDNRETCILGVIEWAKVMRTGRLRIGVRYLPGQVESVDLHATGPDHPASGRSSRAFMLHAVPTLKIPASLVVPPGWFAAGRTVEVASRGGKPQQLRMDFIVERGPDYERIGFTPV